MDHDPQPDALHAAITTAEHRSLEHVLDVIRRLEDLRARGLTSAQIAERIRLTHPNRPGGGPWSPETVERVLEIADASRNQGRTDPSGQHDTQPVPRTSSTVPLDQRSIDPAWSGGQSGHTYPPPIERAVPGGRQVAEPQPAGEHPMQRPDHRSPAAYVAVGDGGDERAPLRVEPRRYHQRPTTRTETALDPDRSRRWPALAGFFTLVGVIAVGVGLYQVGVLDRFTAANDQAAPAAPQTTDSEAADDQATADQDTDGSTDGEGAASAGNDGATDGTPDGGDEPDTLVIRIEPSTPEADGIAPASATVRTDGKLYIEGAFRSESEAERFLESAAEVFGEAALVPGYTIDPAAPDPTVSDVVLEKPVLFETGSATIDPEYIPFLEACGDVLKLNSHIVMSVSAFTDASGSAEFNLELSQQRADAVIDYYRNLDIGDDQLISTGFGESDFVADNGTEEGRRQNRRAMLELLNVMRDG